MPDYIGYYLQAFVRKCAKFTNLPVQKGSTGNQITCIRKLSSKKSANS